MAIYTIKGIQTNIELRNLNLHDIIKVQHESLGMTYAYEIMSVPNGYIYNYFTHAVFVPRYV